MGASLHSSPSPMEARVSTNAAYTLIILLIPANDPAVSLISSKGSVTLNPGLYTSGLSGTQLK